MLTIIYVCGNAYADKSKVTRIYSFIHIQKELPTVLYSFNLFILLVCLGFRDTSIILKPHTAQ